MEAAAAADAGSATNPKRRVRGLKPLPAPQLRRRRRGPCCVWLMCWMALEFGQQGRSAGDPLVLLVGPVAGAVRHAGGVGRERAACFLCVLRTPSSSRTPRAAAAGRCHADFSAACERMGAATAARRGVALAGRCIRRAARMQAGGAGGAGAGGGQPPADLSGEKGSAAAPLPINSLMRRAMLIRAVGTNKTLEAPPEPQNTPPARPAPAPELATPREITVPAPALPRPSAMVADQAADTWSPSGIASGTSEGAAAPGAAQARRRRGRPKKDSTTAAGLAGGATPVVKPTTKARPKAKAKRAASPPFPAVRATQDDEGSSAPKRGRGRPPRAAKAREEQRGLDRLGVTSRRERTVRLSGGADGPDGQELLSNSGSAAGSRTADLPPAGASQKSPLYQIQKDIPQWVKVRAAKQDSESAALRHVLVKKADPVESGAPGGTVIDVEDLDYLPAFEDVRAPPQAVHANASTISPQSAAQRKLVRVTASPSAR
jgi:hypothetical protein